MVAEERRLLALRIDAHLQSSHKLHTIIIFGSLAAIMFVSVAWGQIHRDVLARLRVEENLRTMNKELESFSYSVSHDLRAPLRGIEGFSELIRTTYTDRLDAEGLGYFDRICAAAKRMGVLIDEILNLSRITRSPLEIQDVDLSALTREIAAELQRNDPTRRVVWIIPESMRVRGDPALLQVALVNLLANAWKFTSKRDQATVEIGKMGKQGKTVFYVRDDGAGFDMAYQAKLFQASSKAAYAGKEFPGTGIRPATVQRVVHRHGGTVWAEGEVERGATFYFTLA